MCGVGQWASHRLGLVLAREFGVESLPEVPQPPPQGWEDKGEDRR